MFQRSIDRLGGFFKVSTEFLGVLMPLLLFVFKVIRQQAGSGYSVSAVLGDMCFGCLSFDLSAVVINGRGLALNPFRADKPKGQDAAVAIVLLLHFVGVYVGDLVGVSLDTTLVRIGYVFLALVWSYGLVATVLLAQRATSAGP